MESGIARDKKRRNKIKTEIEKKRAGIKNMLIC